MEIGCMNKNWLAELAADGAGAIAASLFVCFSTVMTSPGPAFQECTGSCHVNVPTIRQYHHNLQSTDGMTVLAWIGTISNVLQDFKHNESSL